MKSFILLLLLLLFSSCSQILDSYYGSLIVKHELYKTDFGDIKSLVDIPIWMGKNGVYKADVIEEWSSPQETLERGYGDCEDIAILFMNIAYLELGIKMDLVLVNTNQRHVVSGGIPNHAEVRYDSLNYNIYSGMPVNNREINYIYYFKEIFY